MIPFLLVLVLPALTLAGLLSGGVLVFAAPVFVFGLVPLLDRVVGDNGWNARTELEPGRLAAFSNAWRFQAVLYIYLAAATVVTFLAIRTVGAGGVSPGEWMGITASLGVMNGAIGITVAHEFIHRRSPVERAAGVFLLLLVCYPHCRIEHVQGHHAHVATPNDPATGCRGQTVYAFWRQSVCGSARSAWKIERTRLDRLGRSPWGLSNRMLRYAALETLLIGAIWVAFGWLAAVTFLVQAVLAFSLLEVVNYVEHYGLEREWNGARYERVAPAHSWDSSRRLTNYLLVNLQRHADHHTSPQHRYQVLAPSSSAPQLPSGYAEMVMLALVPPLWFRRIDPRIPRSG